MALLERKYLVISHPGRCVATRTMKIPKNKEQEVKKWVDEVREKAKANPYVHINANIIVKDIFGKTIRTE